MIERDNIHYTTRKIDGYNLPFNFIISEREAGKSTAIWLDKVYKGFKEHGWTSIVVRRNVNDITDSYINDMSEIINKFTNDNVIFKFSSASIKSGIVDVYLNGKRFIRVIGLSKKIASIKSLVLRDLKYIIFDEFICNARFGEKYLKNEAIKFMEIYNTFRREAENLKCFFLGNPYSLYNPYFIFFNVDTHRLTRGTILSDKKSYVIECYEITKELRAKILEENPLYQFDNSYTAYAFNGVNVNDLNIVLKDKRECSNYKLDFVFKIESKFIGVYRNNVYEDLDNQYYVEFLEISNISKRRDIICFDFDELVDRTMILSPEERWRYQRIKDAMRKRAIAFNNIECYYLFEEIYYNL